ncbi:MAG TPA: ABC transporter permease [Terriglobia bacterium]
MNSFWGDLRYAVRTLRRSPGFTCAALLTLALGIGANTAIYTVVDGVLLHPVPFPEADRLVSMYQKTAGTDRNSVPYLNFLDWRRQARSFESIAGMRDSGFTLTGRGDAEQLIGMMVSQNFLPVLGIQPLIGRNFTSKEDQRGAQQVVMLGEDFWKRRFAADKNVLGQTLTLNGLNYTIIGVVPSAIRMERAFNSFFNDVFTPIGQYETFNFYSHGVGNGTLGIGRLKPGVTLAQARAEMDTIMSSLAEQYPDEVAGEYAEIFPFLDEVVGSVRPALLALAAAVGFVLLIACTNVANLALARSMKRSEEFGIRMALGAGRSRIIRQLLTESMLLSIAGGIIGVAFASWATQAAIAVLPAALPSLSNVQLNNRVLLFTFAVSAAAGVLFGFLPALKAVEFGLHETLKQSGRGTVKGRHRSQRVLIVAEIALTLVLLVGAGLMIRSLEKVWNVNPGLNPDGLLTFYTGISKERASTPEKARAAFRELQERLAAVPGVQSVSIQIGGLPFLSSNGTSIAFRSENEPKAARQGDMHIARFYAVGADHFKTMGIRVLRGRGFTAQDTEKSTPVTVIDEELAHTVFPGQNPIGKHIFITLEKEPKPIEIVGVAEHVKHAGLDADASAKLRMEYYFPVAQMPDDVIPLFAPAVACLIRTKTAPATLLPLLRRELAAFDSNSPLHSEELMTDAIAATLAPRRFSLIVLGAFGFIALLLSVIGIYGVISYSVSQRIDEIGLRMALGAPPRDIVLGVLREGGKLAAIGVAAGLLGAAALTRILSTLLFAVSPTDALTYVSMASLLFGLTLLACYIPARRAIRVDPMAALRCE